MTIGDLIKNKDYDYVSYRLTLQDGSDIFAGCFVSKDGEIVSLDGDTIYDEKDEVLSYKEWSMPEESIQNGLTVVVKGEWYTADEFTSFSKNTKITGDNMDDNQRTN